MHGFTIADIDTTGQASVHGDPLETDGSPILGGSFFLRPTKLRTQTTFDESSKGAPQLCRSLFCGNDQGIWELYRRFHAVNCIAVFPYRQESHGRKAGTASPADTLLGAKWLQGLFPRARVGCYDDR